MPYLCNPFQPSKLTTAISLILALSAAQVEAKGLREAVQHTINTNPDILITKNQYLAEREQIRQAKAGYYPTVDVNAGIGPEWSDDKGIGSRDLTRKELGLRINQNLFLGKLTSSEVARFQAKARATAHKLNGDAETVGLQAVKAYLDVLRRQGLLDLANQSFATHRRIQDQIKLRNESGVGSKADLDQIDTRVALAQSNMVAAKVNYLDAQTAYLRVVGEMPDKLSKVPGLGKDLPGSLEEAIRLALEKHPILKSAYADVDEATEQHHAANYNNLPRLDLELSANKNDDIDGTEGYQDDASAMLRMRWNLYNGGKDAARRRETAHQINEAKEVRNRTHRQVEESIRLSWAAYQATKQQMAVLQQQIQAGIRTRDAYKEQFQVGDRTLLDILNTETDLLKAREELLNAQQDYLFAQYRIATDLGILMEAMNIALYKDETKEVPEYEKARVIPDYTDQIYPKDEYMDIVKKHQMKVIGSPHYKEGQEAQKKK